MKRIYIIAIMTGTIALAFSGCGKREKEPEVTPGIQQTVTIVKEETKDMPKETEAPVKEEVTESQEMPEVTESTEEETDWASYYEAFMETPLQDIYGKNIKMDSIIDVQGVEMKFSMADMDGVNFSGIGFGDYWFEMYTTPENIYACSLIDGKRNWKMAENSKENEAAVTSSGLFNNLSGMAGSFTEVSEEPISSIMELKSYEGSIQEDVLCDILHCEISALEYKPQVDLYIIRETGRLHHMDMDIVLQGQQVSYKIYYKEIEEVEIPLEARVAPEGTVEEMVQLQNDVLIAYSTSVSQ